MAIHTLQGHIKIVEIRKEKKRQLQILDTYVKEISLLVTKLNNLLPNHSLRIEPVQQKAEKKISKQAEAKKVAKAKATEVKKAEAAPAPEKTTKKGTSELEKLESQLSYIESALQTM